MLERDTIWDCWLFLFRGIAEMVWDLRWPIAIYAVLYAIGAAVFLLSLRFKSRDGRLVVERDSWAFMFAHPMQYGGHRAAKQERGSICTFYARMFNMLLVVWPFLLLWFVFHVVIAFPVYFLFGGGLAWPNLHEEGFFKFHRVVPFPLVIITIPVALIALAVWKLTALLWLLKTGGWILLCGAPLLVVLALLGGAWLKSKDTDSETVSAFREAVIAKKERFCKLIEFHG